MPLAWCAECGAYVDHDPWDVHPLILDAPLRPARWTRVLAAAQAAAAAQAVSRAVVASVAGAIASLSASKHAT